ncbi:MAG TPA: hypothetical protein VFF30_07550 [Nitrososphaerales archaeon]|nr:hypothetical protein [Nitrososphaerales archaeon]
MIVNFRSAVFFLLGVSVLLAPLLLAAWFSLCPQFGNPQCPTSADTNSALLAFKADSPTLMGIFLTVNTIVPYVYPLSYLGLGYLSAKRSPIFSAGGVIAGWFGSIAWGFIGAAIFVYYDAANLLPSSNATTLMNSIYLHWQIYYIVATGWVLGHLFGYVLLGIALYRSRIIPRWASALLIISAPLMGPFAYGLNNGWLQVAGYLLVLIACIPVANSLITDNKNDFSRQVMK